MDAEQRGCSDCHRLFPDNRFRLRCPDCQKKHHQIKAKEWKKKNPEKVRAYYQKWKENHPEEYAAHKEKARISGSGRELTEKRRAYRKEYVQMHRNSIREYNREYKRKRRKRGD